ncbi:MAG: PadR family transcriptional regulator [Candidatus Bathyarchaeia archaeon]
MEKLEKDLVKAVVRGFRRIIILWLISQKPMSGYGIVKELERLTNQKYTSGVVYPILYELEEKRLIVGKWMRKGRRQIKYYSTTKKGTEFLDFTRELFEMPVKEILKDFIAL